MAQQNSFEYREKIKILFAKKNAFCKVKLRCTIAKDNIYIFVEFWNTAKKKKERKSLGIKLSGNPRIDKEKLKIAYEIQKAYELKYYQDNFGFELEDSSLKINFIDVARNFSKKFTKNTQNSYTTAINKVIAFWGSDNVSIGKLDEKFFEKFVEYLRKNGSNDASIHVALTKIKAVFNELVKKKIIKESPVSNINIKFKPKANIKVIPLEDLKKLANSHCKNEEIKNAFLFACSTGLRVSDIRRLSFPNIKKIRGYFELSVEMKKTKQRIEIKLNSDAEKIYLGQLKKAKTSKVFTLPPRSSVLSILKKWTEKTIGQAYSFHASRHTFAVNFLNQKGVDIYRLKEMLGHSNINSTLVYAKYLKDEKYKALDSMPELLSQELV